GEPQTVDELRQLLMQAKPVKACDEVDWTLFGLSMATYNVAFSLALALASCWGARQIRRAP
ncbi:MAG TPA: disulfide bond formation protein B, partial [Rhodospirillales bacterium]|nr:disulfide bond formation protein B [Rhodospirillales bacterium]